MKTVYLIIILTFVFTQVFSQTAPISPTNLRVNYCIEHLGIDESNPRFSWVVNDNDRAELQTAYEIIVASSFELIAKNTGDVWSSGKINSSKQNGIFYNGVSLTGKTKYWWKVRTWDKDGMQGAWSNAASFETAMMNESDWKASFLSGKFNMLRGEFKTLSGKTIVKARAYVTCTGWFELRINGNKVGDHVLDPLTTQNSQLNLYPVFDVTSLLNNNGSNAVGMMCGTALRYRDDVKQAICQIDIWYSDNTTQSFCSDGSWKMLWGGPIYHQHVFDGERYDARKELPGWDMPGYNDAAWLSPTVSAPGIPAGWTLNSGVLDVNGGGEGIIKSGQSWTNFTLEVDINIVNTCGGVMFRSNDTKNGYMWQFNPGNPGLLRPHKLIGGSYSLIGSYPMSIQMNTNTWYHLKIEVNGQNIKTYIGNILVNELNDNSLTSGRIGFRNSVNEHAQFDNIKVTVSGTEVFSEDFSSGLGQWGGGLKGYMKVQTEPIKISEVITPVKMTSPKAGVYVFDMGKNISGWAELTVNGNAGDIITMKFAERMYSSGMIDRSSTVNGLPAEAIDTFICKGGLEIWEPRFTYHGFRYVELTGFPGTPTINTLKGKMFHSAVDNTISKFNSSNEILNKIYNSYKLTQLDNLMGYPTDCNQRGERAGWLADAMVTSESTMLYFDAFRFYEKWINDLLIDEQSGGGSGCLIPGGGQNDIIWGAACVSVPWDFYQMSGDSSILVKTFERAKRYVNWIKGLDANKNYIYENDTEGKYVNWNDWNPPGANDLTNKPTNDFMGSAYYFHVTDITAQMAKTLNKTADYNTYSTLATTIRNAINTRFLKNNSYYDNNKQTANAVGVGLGIVPDAFKATVASSLNNSIVSNSNHIGTGCLGTYSIFSALADNGFNKTAITMNTLTTYPSYGFMLSQTNSPGTLWETWQNADISKNHPFLGGAGGSWLFNHVAGIKSSKPGFSRIIMKPGIDGSIDSASGTVNCVRGTITSAWLKKGNTFNWHVVIPANVSAKLYIPNLGKGVQVVIKESGIELWKGSPANKVQGLFFDKIENGFLLWNAGSGVYDFSVVIDTTISPITNGLTGNYFNDINFIIPAFQRLDTAINFIWGADAPAPSVNADNFSIRWTGFIKPSFSEIYTFYVRADNGKRLWINNVLLVDSWRDDCCWDSIFIATIPLTAGQLYDFKMEMYDATGGASAVLQWSSASTPKQVVPQTNLFTVITGINDVFSIGNEDAIRLYPNPAKNELLIFNSKLLMNKDSQCSLQISDMQGRIVKSFSFRLSALTPLDISSLNNGVYIVICKTDTQILQNKLIINK